MARRRTCLAAFACAGAGLSVAASPGAPNLVGPRQTAAAAIVGGRLFTADGGPLADVRVTIGDGRAFAPALVDSAGVFVGALPPGAAGPVVVRVASDQPGARYLPSIVTLTPGASATSIRVVILPAAWTIDAGTYLGRTVAIDPVRAVARAHEASGYWRLNRRSLPSARPLGWPADSLPLRVAFRRQYGDAPISDRDSVEFWRTARRLEQLLGRALFRPTSADAIEAGADGVLVAVNARMAAAGRTFITFDANGRIYDALVTVQRRGMLGAADVTMHELMHALGFGHTTSWASVMGPSTSDLPVPSPEDVAHAQLLYRVEAVQRANDAPYGIPEAVAGARARALAAR